MYRRTISIFSFILLLGLTAPRMADAELIGWWKLDEGSGTTATDSSGNGNDASFQGAPVWVEDGKLGKALRFNGSSDYLAAPDSESLDINGDQVSMAAWINGEDWPAANHIVRKVADTGTGSIYMIRVQPDTVRVYLNTSAGESLIQGTKALPTNEWNHVAVTYNGAEAHIYVNGEVDVSMDVSGELTQSDNELRIGRGEPAGYFMGMIDDVRLYNHGLTESELLSAMEGSGAAYPLARGPDPKDGALHADTWVNLSWSPGDFAVSHDVYLGDNFEDVDNGTGETFRGNQTSTLFLAGFPGFAYPDGLVPGTTYYWRIDEVNEADPNSPWKGPVWSFSIPPKTAYNPDPADGAESIGPDNVTLSWTPGFGAILHTAYFGDNFDEVNNATGGVTVGAATYNPGILELEKVYYWRVDEFDAAATHKGDIWFFTTPGTVGNPQPAYGATDVGMNATLSWVPADGAASHELYFGTDKEAVRNANTISSEYKGSVTLGAESYDPGLLDADTSYYWRVNEIDSQGNVAKGPVWVFTTGDFLLIDDFESYTDDDPNNEAIWQTWIDGFGVADNGSQVGNLLPPYAEQTIVHGGAQSMPLFYTNEGGVTNSEATLMLTSPRDWTLAGVSELSIWFRGASGNAADPLYVAVSNSAGSPAMVAQEDPEAPTVHSWTQWRIPLKAFADQGINLSDVDKIAIGLGSKSGMASAGGSGTIFIDDIRLYRQ
jgi:hypothetical protein